MSLSLKYLVPLNLVIAAVWTIHVVGSQAALEEAMLGTERESMEQLACSVKLHLEDLVGRGENVESAAATIAEMTNRYPGLDMMIVDRDFTVRLASVTDRIGKRWHESGIESVLGGESASAWNLGDHSHDGRRAIDTSLPIVDADGQVLFVVHIGKWLDRLLAALDQQRRQDMITAVLELLAVGLAVNLLTYLLVLQPLHGIRRQIADSGWLGAHPKLRRRDEIKHLGTVVSSLLDRVQARTEDLRSSLGKKESALQRVAADRDHLADRVERVTGELADTESRLVRAERIATLARLSGALAHELRNPLHIIRATAETAARQHPEVGELATDIKDEVDRVNRLISELLDYTRPSDLHAESVDVRDLLEEVRTRLCRGLCDLDPASCELCVISLEPTACTVDGDPVLLEQAMMNLIANARDASPDQAVIDIGATAHGDDEVEITVADRGPGVEDEDRDRIFEPFFSRKAAGTGLGLPAVQKIADLHEGAIELVPREGGGTIARLRLPVRHHRGGL